MKLGIYSPLTLLIQYFVFLVYKEGKEALGELERHWWILSYGGRNLEAKVSSWFPSSKDLVDDSGVQAPLS